MMVCLTISQSRFNVSVYVIFMRLTIPLTIYSSSEKGTFVVNRHLPWPLRTEILPIELFAIISRIFFTSFLQYIPRIFFRQSQMGGCCLLQNELSRNHFLNMVSSHLSAANPKWFRDLHRTFRRHHHLNFNILTAEEKRTVGGKKASSKWWMLITNFLHGGCNLFGAGRPDGKHRCEVNSLFSEDMFSTVSFISA